MTPGDGGNGGCGWWFLPGLGGRLDPYPPPRSVGQADVAFGQHPVQVAFGDVVRDRDSFGAQIRVVEVFARVFEDTLCGNASAERGIRKNSPAIPLSLSSV